MPPGKRHDERADKGGDTQDLVGFGAEDRGAFESETIHRRCRDAGEQNRAILPDHARCEIHRAIFSPILSAVMLARRRESPVVPFQGRDVQRRHRSIRSACGTRWYSPARNGLDNTRNDPFPRESRIRGPKGGFRPVAQFFHRDDPPTRFRCVVASSRDRFIAMHSSSRRCDRARDRSRARSSSCDRRIVAMHEFFYVQRSRAPRSVVIRRRARQNFFAPHRRCDAGDDVMRDFAFRFCARSRKPA